MCLKDVPALPGKASKRGPNRKQMRAFETKRSQGRAGYVSSTQVDLVQPADCATPASLVATGAHNRRAQLDARAANVARLTRIVRNGLTIFSDVQVQAAKGGLAALEMGAVVGGTPLTLGGALKSVTQVRASLGKRARASLPGSPPSKKSRSVRPSILHI